MEKKFILTATLQPDDTVKVVTETTGFSTTEIIGILETKKKYLLNQLKESVETGLKLIINKEKEQ